MDQKTKIPKIPHAFFKWYCREDRYEEIHGDIEEYYYDRLSKMGLFMARLHYLLDVIRGCQPYAWKKIERSQNTKINMFMSGIDLKTTFRILYKNKLYTTINVLGLALGFACILVIYLKINHELNFDRHHQNYDRIYRIVSHYGDGDIDKRSGSHYPMSNVLKNDFPEIEKSTLIEYRIDPALSTSIKGEFNTPKTYKISYAYVEPEFQEIFDLQWKSGNPESAFSEPNSVAITEKLATRLFGENSEAIPGRQIDLNYGHKLTITGIIEDPPIASEFDMDMLISFNSMKGYQESYDNQDWGFSMGTLQAYVLLNKESVIPDIENKLNMIPSKYIKSKWAEYLEYFLQPLSDLHYNSNYQVLVKEAVTKKSIWTLAFIGAFMLVIATINYINLSAANALKNQKTAGIRKIMGCSRAHLVMQAFGESFTIVLSAMVIGLFMATYLLTYLKEYTGLEQELNLAFDGAMIGFLFVVFLLTSVTSAWFPARIQMRASPSESLKNKLVFYKGGVWLKRSLVIIQFVVAQVLIVGTIMLIQQIDYMENVKLGFNQDGIINIPLPENDKTTLNKLRNELSQYHEIEKITFAVNPPIDRSFWFGEYGYHHDGNVNKVTAHIKFVDQYYIDTYEVSLTAGRDFVDSDSSYQVIINKEFAKKMGYKNSADAIGEKIEMYDTKRTIVGVVENFHAQSLHEEIPAVVLMKTISYNNTAGIKINLKNTEEALVHIEEAWKATYPDREYSYSFLNETIAGFYEKDRQETSLINLFSIVSMIIACLGIYGLVSFMVAQKVKEIGIRKVLGATILNLLSMMSKEFVILVLIALLISVPAGYYGVQMWLEGFPYRVGIKPDVFMIAGLISVIIAVLTVSLRSVKVALANPINSLRDE